MYRWRMFVSKVVRTCSLCRFRRPWMELVLDLRNIRDIFKVFRDLFDHAHGVGIFGLGF